MGGQHHNIIVQLKHRLLRALNIPLTFGTIHMVDKVDDLVNGEVQGLEKRNVISHNDIVNFVDNVLHRIIKSILLTVGKFHIVWSLVSLASEVKISIVQVSRHVNMRNFRIWLFVCLLIQ